MTLAPPTIVVDSLPLFTAAKDADPLSLQSGAAPYVFDRYAAPVVADLLQDVDLPRIFPSGVERGYHSYLLLGTSGGEFILFTVTFCANPAHRINLDVLLLIYLMTLFGK